MKRWGGFLCCLLLVITGLPVVVAVDPSVTIHSVTPTGDGIVETQPDPDRTYLWRSEPFELQITVESTDSREYEICVESHREGDRRQIGCRSATVSGTETISVSGEGWPTNASGLQDLQVRITPANDPDGSATTVRNHTVHVISKSGDLDDDGLGNQDEIAAGTNISNADTDGDLLSDGKEVNSYGTDPLNVDTDDDGLEDGPEVHTYQTNPTNADTDEDGLDDGVEVNEYETNPNVSDTDGDDLDDATEVRDVGTNPNKADTDGDGLEDGAEVHVYETDPTSVDTDDDGLDDGAEVKEYETNPTKADTDEDGLDDGAEVNVHGTDPLSPDTDGDGVSDKTEIQQGTDPAGDRSIWKRLGAELDLLPTLGLLALLGVLVATLWMWYFSGSPSPFSSPSPPLRSSSSAPPDGSTDDSPTDPDDYEEGVSDLENKLIEDGDRVMQLLHDSDGRIKQSRIVEQTDWSKSKTSRVLSEMVDDGKIRKITIGRENLIVLPGELPSPTVEQEEDAEG